MLEIVILAAVTAQRLGELVLARANTRRLREAGAVEIGAAHYPVLVGFHAAWLAGLWLLAPGHGVVWPWLALFLALQALRVWVIASLGRRWTTRVIVLPDAPLVARGPYRFLRHPNYLVVALEIPVLPLAFGMPAYAFVFALANAVVLAWRIRAEDAALQRR